MHIQWLGKTLYLGTASESEFDSKLKAIKALVAQYRKKTPIPSREWVIAEIHAKLNLKFKSSQSGNMKNATSKSEKRAIETINVGSSNDVIDVDADGTSYRYGTTVQQKSNKYAVDDANFQLTSKYIKKNRGTLCNKWILDKRLGSPSLRGYFEAMNISKEMAESHVKKDEAMDIMCHIDLTTDVFKIRAFYIQDVENPPQILIAPLGKEQVERAGAKRTIYTSDSPSHVVMKRSMHTVTGYAEICDTKEVVYTHTIELPEGYTEQPEFMMRQTMTVENHESKKTHTIIRYYLPVDI
jgi:hypothetical protein